MRIFIAGGTGVIGRRVVPNWSQQWPEQAKARLLSELGATPVRVDLFDPPSLDEAVRGHEVVFKR